MIVRRTSDPRYYTLNGSQRNFLMDNGFTQSQATSITLAFATAVYAFCVPGGVRACTTECNELRQASTQSFFKC